MGEESIHELQPERRADIHQLSAVIGGLQTSVKELQRSNENNIAAVHIDIQRLYDKMDEQARAFMVRYEELYKRGCVKAEQHSDQEERLRGVEAWKIAHDSATQALATTAGANAGAEAGAEAGASKARLWGAGAAALIYGLLTLLASHFTSKGSGQ